MASVLKRIKALTVNPLKSSQPLGAALAFLGLNRAMPLMHGAQGCTAFAKVMFVRHFREPIPLQTTAMDQVSAVMGADDSIEEALVTIFSKQKPQIVGLMTTGLAETQGADIARAVRQFRMAHPEFAEREVVAVNTPDFNGGLESGFAAAVSAIIRTLVPKAEEAGTRPGRRPRQVNILVSPSITPGDAEALAELVEAFELRPIILPDLSGSLDGHLEPEAFTPYTTGGTALADVVLMGDSAATLVIGPSLVPAAELLEQRTGVPVHRFEHLYGLAAVDRFVHVLSRLADRPVPTRIERQRAQLQDAMVDCHFMLGQWRAAVAGEPDQLLAVTELLQGMGAEVVCAVAPAQGPALAALPLPEVKIGDLEDLEHMARAGGADVIVGNSHCGQSAERLGLPLFRLGFPQYDVVGGYQRTCIGYRGTRQMLFDLANLALANHRHSIAPYRSIYGQKPEYRHEDSGHVHTEAIARV
ncbi:MAG: nitrogenase iron-molybdenum cofactor biosynthesis protein NifN [Thiohalomonadaceae bacterium]